MIVELLPLVGLSFAAYLFAQIVLSFIYSLWWWRRQYGDPFETYGLAPEQVRQVVERVGEFPVALFTDATVQPDFWKRRSVNLKVAAALAGDVEYHPQEEEKSAAPTNRSSISRTQ